MIQNMKKAQNINNLPELKTFRKELRNHGTSAEAFLWTHLKQKQLEGKKFRRQFSVGHYILDFYCHTEKLCVELDGNDHFTNEQMKYDEIRTKFLNDQGIKVIRFENCEVFDHTESVLEEIRGCFG